MCKSLCYYIQLCVHYCQPLADWKELEEIPQQFEGWKNHFWGKTEPQTKHLIKHKL